MPFRIDTIDRRILEELQGDGRLQNLELSERVGIAPSTCLRRVRRLEEAGVIEKYLAHLNAAAIGFGFTVYVRVWLTAGDAKTVRRFIDQVQALPEVMECYMMAGDCDFLLRVVSRDLDAYRQFREDFLSRIPGVQAAKTDIPMQVVKQSTSLPLSSRVSG